MKRLAMVSAVLVALVAGLALAARATRRNPQPIWGLGNLNPSWPGERNEIRDMILSQGAEAVPSLVVQAQRRDYQDWRVLRWLENKLPPYLAGYLPKTSPETGVRRTAACWMLGELGPQASTAVLALRRIVDKSVNLDLRSTAVLALARIQPGNAAALSNATILLFSPQQTERFLAAQVMGSFTNLPGFNPALLVRTLADSDGEVRANAAHSLAQFGPRGSNAVPQLRALLSDPYRHVSVCAAYALVCIAPQTTGEAIVAVTNAIGRRADMVDFTAPRVFKVAGTNARAAVPLLESILAKRLAGFPTSSAAVALWQIRREADPAIIRELVGGDQVSPESLTALGEMGAAASNAVPFLRKWAGSGVPGLHEAAAGALQRVTGSGPSP